MTLAVATDPGDAPDDFTTGERAVIGCLLRLDAAGQDRILARIGDDEFGDPQCRWIVPIIRGMRAAGSPVDEILVAGWVRSNALLATDLQRKHLASTLHRFAGDAPTGENADWYVRLVLEGAARRAVDSLGDLGAHLSGVSESGTLVELRAALLAGTARAMFALARATEGA